MGLCFDNPIIDQKKILSLKWTTMVVILILAIDTVGEVVKSLELNSDPPRIAFTKTIS